MLLGLDAVLAALDDELLKVKEGASHVIDDTVNTCTQLGIDYCPVDTGELQSTITSSPAEEADGSIIGASGIPDGVSTYAWYVENGHFTRNHHSFVPANPFLQKAFFEVQPTFFSDMGAIDL